MLKSLDLKPVYSTEDDDLLRDFYIPILGESVTYDRAVGFFSAQMLSLAAEGMSALFERRGRARVIVGAALPPDEDEAIRAGYLRREVSERLGRSFCEVIENIADGLARKRLETLSWLVAGGQLDVKVALRSRGMFHDKHGIARDEAGDAVVFQGSANETAYALLPEFNYESINVFTSWNAALRDYFSAHERKFNRLWSNQVRNTVVVPFPDVARQLLLDVSKTAPYPAIRAELAVADPSEPALDETSSVDGGRRALPEVPRNIGANTFSAFDHQRKALDRWRGNDFNGVLKHATGSGKTITTIYGATRLFEAMGRLFLIVSVPYQNLADQWVSQLRLFGWHALRCYRSRADWEEDLREKVVQFVARTRDVACVVVVNRSLTSTSFQSAMRDLDAAGGEVMFVADECHHFGAQSLATAVSIDARYRLGLSATPEDEYSAERTARVYSTFGQLVHEFSLAEALKAGVLTPYDYEIVICKLDGEETERYLEVTSQIARRLAVTEDEDDESLRVLYGKRARILAHCHEKLVQLEKLLSEQAIQPLSLFYCGDGAVEDEAIESSLRHVEMVSSILDRSGWKASTFTARESLADRRRTFANFEAGLIDAVVAIRCLDEGVDVPACRTAYILASSRNPRQFVQRRGRILRRSPGKTGARVVDFLVTLPGGLLDNKEGVRRRLVAAELTRVVEFAKLARNADAVFGSIRELLAEHDLTHQFVSDMTS